MTVPSDLPLPITEPTHLPPPKLGSFRSVPSPDLVFTQDGVGRYLSFYWQDLERYGLDLDQLIGSPMDEIFSPLSVASYLKRVQQVLESQTPLRFEYPFQIADQYLVFDLTLSPVLIPHGSATMAVVSGCFLYTTTRERALDLVNTLLHLNSPQYGNPSKRLTQAIWKIRRHLDLSTIWQHTVQELGEALEVSRCLVCPYLPNASSVTVVAEYGQSALKSLLGTEIPLDSAPYAGQALTALEPVVMDAVAFDPDEPAVAVLALATTYQNQPNGLILLQLERSSLWQEVGLDLLQEVAVQVGTGVAAARLLEETQTLVTELQQINEHLMQQHQEVEDARQQAEAASRLKSEFLANTSHELRTPLNGMIGFLKLIMDGMADDPEEQNQFIQEAHRSAIHLLNIINDILDIAKIEAGKMQLDLNPIKLDDLLNDVENFTRPQAQQKNLAFEIRIPATRDEVVLYGNYQRLLQVMLNLVGNAIKFTHEGEITISAEIIPGKVVIQDEEKPGTVRISVADTGIGVSLEKQDKLFQTFSQVDASRTRQYGGTGLGLAISQRLVEAMGGVVHFFSMGEGLGSTVTFTVPLYQDPVMITSPVSDTDELLL